MKETRENPMGELLTTLKESPNAWDTLSRFERRKARWSINRNTTFSDPRFGENFRKSFEESLTKNPIGREEEEEKISTHERHSPRTFLPEREDYPGCRIEKKACLGRGAGERGAYADDDESGVQRAHSLTLLWPPGKIKVGLPRGRGNHTPPWCLFNFY